MNNYYEAIENKYGDVYRAMYNLSVQHDNLMGKCIDWGFMDKTANEYVELRKDQGKMTDRLIYLFSYVLPPKPHRVRQQYL